PLTLALVPVSSKYQPVGNDDPVPEFASVLKFSVNGTPSDVRETEPLPPVIANMRTARSATHAAHTNAARTDRLETVNIGRLSLLRVASNNLKDWDVRNSNAAKWRTDVNTMSIS